ncbi:ATP-binding protein [Streptomyces sp. NPDC058646]|uniref:ATP-binding protein n=1 Tax=Streptomyces sp. NPDC058646 TaxID=3346574 RepID=UPI00364AA3E8
MAVPTPPPVSVAEARSRVRALFEEVQRGRAADASRPAAATASSGEALANVLLVTSELATNAFRHGGGLTGFGARVERDVLVVTVADASAELPAVVVKEHGPATPGGFGWPLICRLAQQVSVTPLPGGGKSIEAVVPLW